MQNVQKYIDKIRCYAPPRICIKQVVEAKQNQELEKEAIQNQERIELRMNSDVPLRFRFALSELWKPNKTRSCGKEAT